MAKIIPDFYFAEKHRLLYPVNTGELGEKFWVTSKDSSIQKKRLFCLGNDLFFSKKL